MKRIVIFLSIALVSFSSFAQKTNDKKASYNIKNYFLLLPDSVFKDAEILLTSKQRQIALKYKTVEQIWEHKGYWQIDTLDYRNGYIKISTTGGGGGSCVEITYFIKKNKTRLIAVNLLQWDMLRTSSNLKFYTYKNNVWKNVTSNVLPKMKASYFVADKYAKFFNIDDVLYFSLPQKGKNIKVGIDAGAIDLILDDGKINNAEYDIITKSLKEKILYWHDGTFNFSK